MLKMKMKKISILTIMVFVAANVFLAQSLYAVNIGDNFKTAKRINIGEMISGEISKAGEMDYYVFTAKTTGAYTIRTTGDIDTFGTLYDSSFKELKTNDEGDSGTDNFSISSKLEENKTYYISVRHYEPYSTGKYTLSVVKSDFLIESFNENTDGEIQANIVVYNVTKVPVDLSKLALRYYYTKDSDLPQKFSCEYASSGETNVTGKIENVKVKTKYADTYVEIRFNDKAGVIEPGLYTELKIVIGNAKNSHYSMQNDWSFNPKAQEFTITNNITAYLNGTLNWGIEPTNLQNAVK
ncbi:MAG: cellulose binding domain-containing protein [Bacillota bacterium]|nr:cellulose binding domain-containing protein [Bacillota bacterium]